MADISSLITGSVLTLPDRQLSNVMLIRHKHGGFLGSDVAIEIGVLEAGHGQRYEGRSSAVA